jgi:hypothetical protein
MVGPEHFLGGRTVPEGGNFGLRWIVFTVRFLAAATILFLFSIRLSLEETTNSHLLTIVNLSLLQVSRITPSRAQNQVAGTWHGRWTR